MLHPDETDLVIGLLTDAVSATTSPRAALCSPLPPVFAERLPLDISAARMLVTQALRICVEQGPAEQPTWVELLLTLVPDPGQEPIPTIVRRLRNPPPPPPDPLDALLLATDIPFLNRAELRNRLRSIGHAQSPQPVLVVTGPGKSGKSYSTRLIDHYCVGHDRIVYCEVSLHPGQAESTGPADVARDLVSQMGGTVAQMPPVNTSEDRWTYDLATWVLYEAVLKDRSWWLVLDGFNHPKVRADTKKFVKDLAARVTTGVAARQCRVILLGFDHAELNVPVGKVLREEIKPVEEPEIAACIRVILNRTGKNADVQQLVAGVVQSLPGDESRMQVLNDQLMTLLTGPEATNG